MKTAMVRTDFVRCTMAVFVIFHEFDFGDEWRFQCRVMQELEEKTKCFRVIKAVGDPPAQYPNWDHEEP